MNSELVCAKKADIKAINELIRKSKAYWGYDNEFMNNFMNHFQMTKASFDKEIIKLFYLYKEEPPCKKTLVGFYSLSADSNNQLELNNFFIHPDYIGQGFGKKLWLCMLESVKKLGKKKFILWSDPGAEGFYEKMGCKKIGTRESPLMPGRRPVVFSCDLTKEVL